VVQQLTMPPTAFLHSMASPEKTTQLPLEQSMSEAAICSSFYYTYPPICKDVFTFAQYGRKIRLATITG
jgi:hypothetical protein